MNQSKKVRMRFTLLLLGCTILFGCRTRQITLLDDSHHQDIPQGIEEPKIKVIPKKKITHQNAQQFARLLGKDLQELKEKKRVKKWLKYFGETKAGKASLKKYVKRGQYYEGMIKSILKQKDSPPFLYHLAMIESGYSTHARSHAGATGLWQFMKGTGKQYKLRVNKYVDERRDPLRSTIAAVHFLRDLHNIFDSWPLALSAYNAGPSRIMNLIMRANTRDYWELIEKKYFPRETKNYVPKLIAVIILSEQLYKRERFAQKNFEVFPDVISVSVPAPIKLSKIAKKLGLSTQKLKQFNPHLRRSYTPPIYRNYRLWVPENTKKANLNRLLAMKANPSLIGRRYKVRRGDSIYLIAKRYKKSISHIKSINRLTSNRIYPGQVLNI